MSVLLSIENKKISVTFLKRKFTKENFYPFPDMLYKILY